MSSVSQPAPVSAPVAKDQAALPSSPARAGGANRALVQTFHGIKPDHQGRIVLSLLPAKNFALINAMEVTDESR